MFHLKVLSEFLFSMFFHNNLLLLYFPLNKLEKLSMFADGRVDWTRAKFEFLSTCSSRTLRMYSQRKNYNALQSFVFYVIYGYWLSLNFRKTKFFGFVFTAIVVQTELNRKGGWRCQNFTFKMLSAWTCAEICWSPGLCFWILSGFDPTLHTTPPLFAVANLSP